MTLRPGDLHYNNVCEPLNTAGMCDFERTLPVLWRVLCLSGVLATWSVWGTVLRYISCQWLVLVRYISIIVRFRG